MCMDGDGPEGDLSVFSGTGKIRLNGRTVRLSGGRSADLCEKLRTALPGENWGCKARNFV